MVRITIELPDDLTHRARQEAERRGVSLDLILRERVGASLAEDPPNAPSPRDLPMEEHDADDRAARLEERLKSGQPLRDEDLPPIIRSLRGCIKDSGVSEEDYYRYLEEKYL